MRSRQPLMRRTPERFVFIDETAVKTNLTRLRGRSLKGSRVRADALFGRWSTQTLISGLSLDGLIAPWVINGAMNGKTFAKYIETQLVPALEPGTAVILDNLSTHKNQEAAAALQRNGCWFLFLPPYSPDLNPIEQAYSKLKAHLRRIAARSFDDLIQAVGDVCDLVTKQEAWNFVVDAEYASN